MTNRPTSPIFALAAMFAFSAIACAQLAPQPKPAKSETTAPMPDLSGVWQKVGGGAGLTPEELPMTPWGQAKYQTAKPLQGPRLVSPSESNAPELSCLPPGVPGVYFRPHPFEIVQLPDRAIMLFEIDHLYRIIKMGGDYPDPPLDSWMGYAIGRYEGDTLVIDTRQFNGGAWLDRLGHPYSDQLRVVERFRRVDQTTMENNITIEDPKAYTKSFTAKMTYRLRKGLELAEVVCEELNSSGLPDIRPGH